MLGIRCVGVYGCQSEDPFVYFRAKPTQRACAWDVPRDRKRTRKWKSERKTEGDSWQEREVKRWSVKRWEQGREETSQQTSGRQLLRPVHQQMPGWQTRENESAFLMALCGFRSSTRSHEPTECTKVSQTSPFLCLELTQACDCLFFFVHPLGCVFCVLIKEWEILLARDGKNH